MKQVLLIAILGVILLFAAGCQGDDSTSGSNTDGDANDGDVTDGDVTDGDATDGDMVDDDMIDGDLDDDSIDGDEESAAPEFTVVEVDPETSAPLQLAIQACAGLHNRALGGSIYIQKEAHDAEWLDELELEPKAVVSALDFLDVCVAEFPACVRYAYEDQQTLLPNILTVASVLEAIPLDVGLSFACAEVAFDATLEFEALNTPYLATKYVFENYAEETTGLAMLNPGFDTNADDVSDPELIRDMGSALVDFVFSQKLFVHFLVNSCKDSNPDKALLHDIVNAGHWPTPLGVYGYNNSWMVMGGYLHEAQTRCLDSRNMGAIPTSTGNLSFFSTRRAPIRDANELERNEPEDVEYDPNKTYVAFVIGDGDNVRFIMTTRNVWLRQRLSDCEKAENSCEPITWSISPHLPHLAPDILKWYYESTRRTGKDYFILPPSGHLYAYPTSLNEEDQVRFVQATEQDARILGINSTVHWDWAGTWEDAEALFLPKYARADGVIRGVFPVNVPYMFPTFPWWPEEDFFKVLVGQDGGETVVFRPREWRGIDNDSDPFFQSPQKMAEELGGYPKGTVTWVYMTSDGGLNLENSFMEMVKVLPSHVQLVSADTAAKLALIAGRK